MGLIDRDYMHERRRSRPPESPFSPPEPTLGTWVPAILGIACLAFFSYKLYQWTGPKKAPQTPAAQLSTATTDPQSGPSSPTHPTQEQQSARAPQSAGGKTVIRCVSPSGVTLSDGPCEANQAVRSVARYSTPLHPPAPAQLEQRQAPPASVTIYLCKAYNGAMFWAEAHCNQHNALIDRVGSVPGNLSWDPKVQLVRQEQASALASSQSPMITVTSNDAEARNQECRDLDAHIANLDAFARQPLDAPSQDRIRERRMVARDRQFALRC